MIRKAIENALEKEDKRLCPACQSVNCVKNTECKECGTPFARTNTPEDGL